MGRSTVTGNMGMVDYSERDVDRVAALGLAGKVSPLGVDIYRWAYADDARAAVRVFKEVVGRIVSMRFERLIAECVVIQAMKEFKDWACPVCCGRKSVKLADDEVRVCEPCQGSGIMKYTDRARIAGCGMDRRTPYDAIEKPLEAALAILCSADRVTNVALNLALARGQNAA